MPPEYSNKEQLGLLQVRCLNSKDKATSGGRGSRLSSSNIRGGSGGGHLAKSHSAKDNSMYAVPGN